MKLRIVNKDLNISIIESIVDGKGFRLTLFTQGCQHKCKGCHNPTTWDMNGGYEIEVDTLVDYMYNNLSKSPYFSGITISGGDPYYQEEAVSEFVEKLKNKMPNINIWVYTGFLYEEVKDKKLTSLIDVLVDGPFIEEQKDLAGHFKGSKNQRIIELRNI